MKKYKICVEKKVRCFDTIEVEALCPVEAKRVAVGVAKSQERAEAMGEIGTIEFEGKKYPRYVWTESEKPTYPVQIIE